MKQKLSKASNGGFTLIEILIVIGIIAILAAIVLVAVNPAKHFREAGNAQRSANVNAVLNAVGQFIVDKRGVMPTGLTGSNFSAKEITTASGGMGSVRSFCDDLVPEYIGGLPADPEKADQTISGSECADSGYTIDTDYTIALTDGRVTVCAPNTVDVDSGSAVSAADQICVTR